LTVDDKEREITQKTDKELETMLKASIKRKNDLDSILEKANVNTPLYSHSA